MENNKEMIVEGYAVVFNQATALWTDDKGNTIYEIVEPGAFNGCDLSNVVFKYNHSDEVLAVARTSNGSLKLTVDNIGLKVRATLVNTTVGRDLYEMIKTGLLNKMSFAFNFAKGGKDYDSKTNTIHAKKFSRLIDVSAVTNPAYPQTSLYVEGEVERLRAEIKKEAEERDLEVEKLRLKIKLGGMK